MIKKVLVANRGEIAVRIFRAAREMGVRSVAVYSTADANAMHTSLADEAVCIGDPEPAASYLDAAKIIAAAKKTGADAVHPGYGFLSESADFSEACRDAGLTFIGPPPEAMRKLGAKIDAKKLAVENDVPIVPGFFEAGASAKRLKKAAKEIGYPVMIKASAGGGGRGMRVVHGPAEFDHELKMASEEAAKAFGDGAMMVEKLIERPRHIEVQVLADSHGNVACLFERECSLQRRHQKVVEEAPSPVMTNELWQGMRGAAERLVKASGYVGAGTVEFMFDEATGEFFFLEVNARLQVEHPVTEAITGVDLVQQQIKIASGEALSLPKALMKGDRSAIDGHAIEARIISEDPSKGFLPSVGKIIGWAEPLDPDVRVDTGFAAGSEVSHHYDSLLAKLIVHRSDRADAIKSMDAALQDFHILGVTTNISFLLDVVRHKEFIAGEFDTDFLGREFGDWAPEQSVPDELGAILTMACDRVQSPNGADDSPRTHAWDGKDAFRVTGR
ncbi:MAG: ATP-grasp domain-containing protein [Armatimonadetes bacterium]|nr:ATP-grasp domain-containing protein [Armatimonadota bacterium]